MLHTPICEQKYFGASESPFQTLVCPQTVCNLFKIIHIISFNRCNLYVNLGKALQPDSRGVSLYVNQFDATQIHHTNIDLPAYCRERNPPWVSEDATQIYHTFSDLPAYWRSLC